MNALRISSIVGGAGFAVLMLVAIANSQEVQEIRFTTSGGTIQPEMTVEDDCLLFNEDLSECLQLGQFSIIEVNYTIAESDNTTVENFLESINDDFDQFGLEIVSAKYNLAGQKQIFSTIFSVPLISGNLLSGDFPVDNVQVAFNAVTKDKFSAFNLEGIVEFKFNDKVIATKRLWTSSSLANQQKVALNVVDYVPSTQLDRNAEIIPPSLNDRKEHFDFTFTDEEFKIGDKSKIPALENERDGLLGQIASSGVSPDIKPQLRYRVNQIEAELKSLTSEFGITSFVVTLKSLRGTYQAGGESKTFDWQGEFIAYKLDLTVDESRTIILDSESGQTVSVKKSDSAIVVCAYGSWTAQKYTTFYRQTQYFYRNIPATKTDDIKIIDAVNGLTIGEVKSFTPLGSAPVPMYGFPSSPPILECKKITGLMRDTDYIIKINDKEEFPIKTPLEQHNYSVTFRTTGSIGLIAQCNPSNCNNTLTGYITDISSPLVYTVESNFGYDKS